MAGRPKTTLAERLASNCVEDSETGCLAWSRYRDKDGYGSILVAGRTRRAHRVAYELARGAIPVGLQIDHLCRNRACCNPDHLEPVTHLENMRRSVRGTYRQSLKTHCKRGHEYTPENTYHWGGGERRTRICRACNLLHALRHKAKRKHR